MATEKTAGAAPPAGSQASSGGGTLRRIVKYLGEVQSELKKTTWPTRAEVIAQTKIVLALLVFIGCYLTACDIVLGLLFGLLRRMLGISDTL
jgi:preprotein translocase SecE subunit